jgi:hypothetical protein
MIRLLLSALVVLSWATCAFAADVRTPTQEGIVYGVAGGEPGAPVMHIEVRGKLRFRSEIRSAL